MESVAQKTKCILIVEDSPVQSELLRRFLVDNGFKCNVAKDGEAGILSAKNFRPNLIISDVQMPILDGYDMCKILKRDPLLRLIPIILLTVLSDPEDIIKALNAGADAYLTKPFDNERLLTQINRLLSAVPKEGEVYSEKAFDIKINQNHYSVNAGREQILQMLISTYDNAAHQNKLLRKLQKDLNSLNEQLENKVAQRTAALTQEEKRARNAEIRYRTLFSMLPEGVGLINISSWKFIEFNDTTCGQLGFLRNEFINFSLLDLIEPSERNIALDNLGKSLQYQQYSFTTNLIKRDGQPIKIEIRTQIVELDGQKLLNCIFRDLSDVSRTRKLERELEHKSSHDLVTDLPGKALLLEALSQAIHVAKRNNVAITLFAIDLSRLHTITASLGNGATETILMELANRLRSLQPKAGMVSRVHNQDFLYMVDGSVDPSSISELLSRISRAIKTPFEWQGSNLEFDPYIGISVYPKDAKDADSLLQSAQTALFKAKQSGRKGIVLASTELSLEVENLVRMENELRQAFSEGHLEMFFQPRINLKSGKIAGAEALMRWRDPVRGIIPPKDFIPLAQEIGIIGPITNWAINKVCKQQREWLDKNINIVPVSVNLVSEQFHDDEIVLTLKQALAKNNLPSKFLEVELTESTAMLNAEKTIDLLNKIQNLGILIAIDDFGTGYSSLAYLGRFPIDILKIDTSFVQGISIDRHSAAITSAIIAMAKELNFLIVAEGIETNEQRQFLSQHLCEEGQGYLFSKPLPADEFETLLIGNTTY